MKVWRPAKNVLKKLFVYSKFHPNQNMGGGEGTAKIF